MCTSTRKRWVAIKRGLLLSLFFLGCGQDPSFVTSYRSPSEDSDASKQGQSQDQIANEGSGLGEGECAAFDLECRQQAGSPRGSSPNSGSSNPGVGASENGSSDALSYIERTDRFAQEATGYADILWVIDSSGSMKEEQTLLRNNFPKFVGGMIESDIDFQTAVTTTDVCDLSLPQDKSKVVCPRGNGSSSVHMRGQFRGSRGNQVMSEANDGNYLAARFSSAANVGQNGSGFEHGLWAAKLALDREETDLNDALRRPNGFLSIIVVSDEEDDGIGLAMENESGHNYHAKGDTTFSWTHAQMIADLNRRVGQGKYSISAVTGTRDSDGNLCSSRHGKPLEEGTQYIKAANETGGVALSICQENWDTLLGKLSADIGKQVRQFVLKKPAKPESIKVWVDGKLKTEGWSFNSGANAIRFNEDKTPSPGSKILVTYLTLK